MIKTATAKVPVKIFIAFCIPAQQNLWRMLQILRCSALWKVIIDNPRSVEVESIERVALNFKEMQHKHHLNPMKQPWYFKKNIDLVPEDVFRDVVLLGQRVYLLSAIFFVTLIAQKKTDTGSLTGDCRKRK